MGRYGGTKRLGSSSVPTSEHRIEKQTSQQRKNSEKEGATRRWASLDRLWVVKNWKSDFKWENWRKKWRVAQVEEEDHNHSSNFESHKREVTICFRVKLKTEWKIEQTCSWFKSRKKWIEQTEEAKRGEVEGELEIEVIDWNCQQ